MATPTAAALTRRYEAYAARFLAETVNAEPPRQIEPTDEALAQIVSKPTLGRPARPAEYDAIRDAIRRLQPPR